MEMQNINSNLEEIFNSEDFYCNAIDKASSVIDELSEQEIKDCLIYKFLKIALLKDTKTLCKIPEKFLTEEICKIATENDPKTLASIPEEKRTEELCRIAVEKDLSCLIYVPNGMLSDKRTEKNFLKILLLSRLGYIIHEFPEDIVTQEMYEVAIQKDPWNIKYTIHNKMERFLTKEICKNAVFNRPDVLEHVPENLQTENMYTGIVSQSSYNLCFIPKEKITKRVFDVAYACDGIGANAIYLPDKFKTKELCDAIVESNILYIVFIPEKFRTDEMYEKLIKKVYLESNFDTKFKLKYLHEILPDKYFCDNGYVKDI